MKVQHEEQFKHYWIDKIDVFKIDIFKIEDLEASANFREMERNNRPILDKKASKIG